MDTGDDAQGGEIVRMKLLVSIFSFGLIILILQGCSTLVTERTAKTYKKRVQNDMYIILTGEQNRELENLTTDDDINRFLDKFWEGKGIKAKNEYMKRLEYANQHFPDKYGWGRSDRKRIYITYGPPLTIDKTNFTDIPIDVITKVKSLEVWYYWHPGKGESSNILCPGETKGEMKFVFADMNGSGFYKIIDSSEDPGDIDSRIFN
jgi:GWxTD domain-containing protein